MKSKLDAKLLEERESVVHNISAVSIAFDLVPITHLYIDLKAVNITAIITETAIAYQMPRVRVIRVIAKVALLPVPSLIANFDSTANQNMF